MGFWKDIFGQQHRTLDDTKTKSGDGWGYHGWGMTASGIPVNTISALQQSAVLSCVTILSEDLAKLPVQIYRKLDNGGKLLAKDHFLYKLLKSPNEWMTRYEFVQMMQASLVLASNAYAVILRDERAIPTGLVPIHPDRVAIYEAPDGQYYYNVSRSGLHEQAVLREEPMRIPSEDVLHLRWMSTISSLWGTSRVAMMKEAVGLSMALDESTSRIVSSSARPGGLLMTDAKLNKEQAEHIVASFAANHSGPSRSGGIGLLENGMTYEPLTFNTVDTEFVAQRSFQLAEIARSFRIPLYKLGVIEAGDKSDRVQVDQDYLNSTLAPYTVNWSQRLAKTFDIDEEKYLIEFDFQHALRADLKTRLDAMRAGIMGSIYTVNEARQSLDMPRVEGGDVILQPTNVAPLGYEPPAPNTPQSEPGSDVTGTPAQGGDGDPAAPPGDTPAPTD